jgi:hypothetical protein
VHNRARNTCLGGKLALGRELLPDGKFARKYLLLDSRSELLLQARLSVPLGRQEARLLPCGITTGPSYHYAEIESMMHIAAGLEEWNKSAEPTNTTKKNYGIDECYYQIQLI